jgi:acyl-CoA synthetase (AMP-forming)/AMP-acid ligase II
MRLRRHAHSRPEDVFCIFYTNGATESITWFDVYTRSLCYAESYRSLGIEHGDIVAISLAHSPHLFYSYLGAMLLGAVPSFMPFPNPKQRPEIFWSEHQSLFARLEPKLLVTFESNATAARKYFPELSLTVASQVRVERRPRVWDHVSNPTDIACLQHSSGTTSLKKGVALTHAAILQQVEAYTAYLGLGLDDVIASWLPLYHDMGFIACFMTSVICGTTLVALDPFEWVMKPGMLLDAVERHSATFSWLPNFAFSHIVNTVAKDRKWDLSSIRAWINCSEPCKPRTFERFLERFESCGVRPESLQVCYAMAENVFGVTQTSLGDTPHVFSADRALFSEGSVQQVCAGDDSIEILSCGRPIGGVEIAIRDSENTTVGEYAVGEIAMRSPFLFSGYFRQPEKTAEKVRDGWYFTGDRGFIVDGELYVTGRVDDMMILNGRNFHAHEIEYAINEVPGVLPGRAVAIAVEDQRTDATVAVILAECSPDSDAAYVGREVRKRILERLGLAIHEFKALAKGELVKTTSGKISRSKNRELYLANAFNQLSQCQAAAKS